MFKVVDLGLCGYAEATEIQRAALEARIGNEGPDTLFLVEHPPVLTLGANFHPQNLRLPREAYTDLGIEVVETDRGGDVTYHGPGQLVAYPVFELAPVGKDLHRWLRLLEQIVIDTLAQLGLASGRNPVNTGVWIGNEKICAMGIKVRRWVSMHGLALNCNPDLAAFQTIVPCGIEGAYGVTSISRALGREVTVEAMKPALVAEFEKAMRGLDPSM